MNGLADNLRISLQIAVAATLLATAAGLPLAWALSRPGWRGRRLVDVAANLPLALPPTVLGYYLLLLIGRGGPVGWLTRHLWGGTLIFTPVAAMLAQAIVCLPLFVQATRNALEEVPAEVYEAAQVDGAGRRQAIWHVFIPLAWPGVWTGILAAFARSLGEFGATLMVAGNIPGKTQTVSLAIYSAAQAGQTARAHLLAGVLTAVAGLSLWVGLRWRSPARFDRTGRSG